MKLNFDVQNENTKEKAVSLYDSGKVRNAYGKYDTVRAGESTKMSGAFAFDKANDCMEYGKQKKSLTDLQAETSFQNSADYKNYLTVMASSMSGDDFAALVKDGVKPGKVEAADMVTIMDHIKAVMAQSGVVISGFNAESDISMEKLEAMTKDAGYAQALARAFAENDVPLTEENAQETIRQTDCALQITGLSDAVKQFLIEQEAPLTIEQIYRAQFCCPENEHETAASGGGYFADSLSGYFGKRPEMTDYQNIDTKTMEAQIDQVIKEAGLVADEQTRKEAAFLLEKGLLLTSSNLEMLDRMNQLQFPMDRDEILSDIAQALREGKSPKQADLSGNGLYEKAQDLVEKVQKISPQALEKAVDTGETIHIRNLSRMQREIEIDGYHSENQAGDKLLHAQRMLEEVRLKMTVSANLSLLRSNVSIDTTELTELVEKLRALEETQSRTYGLSLPDEAQNNLFTETVTKTAAIRSLPVAVLPGVIDSGVFTLNRIYEQGTILADTYKRAGESYEALMTQPRADLGDRLKDAFSNIDDLLSENGMEATEDNRRAVRILAYNHMEITQENIERVRNADATLTGLLKQMHPAATLSMIRDGMNPLEVNVEELADYLAQQNEELSDQAESFSRFLYRMEQAKEITPDERETYIGIYRLIRQIEKGDGKAIGTVVANGQELSFANLLSAVRTGQKKGVDAKIDDTFGMLTSARSKGSNISDQINHYYKQKAADLLEMLDPVRMKENNVSQETTWEELLKLSQQPDDLPQSYVEQQTQLLRADVNAAAETDVVSYLMANGQSITTDHVSAADRLLKERGRMFDEVKEILKDEEDALFAELDNMKEHFTDAQSAQESYLEVTDHVSQMLETQMLSGDMSLLDIRALSSVAKQLSLTKNLAKEENYELPAMIEGQLTSVHVSFRHPQNADGGISPTGSVHISVTLPGGKSVFADLRMQKDSVSGYAACSDADYFEKIKEKESDFTRTVLSETGKNADIHFVYSSELKTESVKKEWIAGKHPSGPDGNGAGTGKTEEAQGRYTSAKELYLAAKAFLSLLEG